ncbi:glutaminyl-peptide cyclotransferase [Pyxidicoccus fallax]|uniref:Glutaminyl-peptide cyclotransferase n=1 Tax=Pyxidicoccus fallax TaxID=394095 RepID=A0A848LW45_9BACT|nr:glutaminyl-peptide cyclotransferase [Pyxidicoccus fallax]NMO21840.1 glutaminyl-peptide cyclotransferase [Pyxidicoccus fallax]NPC83281.1 glutaminyl-peptide cyclotransferase [Pyxidicoccus fallax]
MRKSSWVLSLYALGASASCAPAHRPVAEPPEGVAPVRKVARIVAAYPHATDAFTQGLVFHQGQLFESTGHRGTLRQLSFESARPVWMESLGDIFTEGLASDGERLYQLTWTEGLLFTWSGTPPRRERTTRYAGEGWGLCYWDGKLVRSDGSATLTFHEPGSFQAVGSVEVTLNGQPQEQLNELECANGVIYANVWHSSSVLEIDPATGNVLAVIDASDLVRAVAAELRSEEAVLNGIAVEPGTGRMFMTGKLWPRLFEVRLELAD